MKKINTLLRKCKTLSKQLSSSNLRSNSTPHNYNRSGTGIIWNTNAISAVYGVDVNAATGIENEPRETVLVGSTRRRYVISSKYLSHPIVNALIEKSDDDDDDVLIVNCEVVLFDHLLWMLENADFSSGSDCLDELADLYCSQSC